MLIIFNKTFDERLKACIYAILKIRAILGYFYNCLSYSDYF